MSASTNSPTPDLSIDIGGEPGSAQPLVRWSRDLTSPCQWDDDRIKAPIFFLLYTLTEDNFETNRNEIRRVRIVTTFYIVSGYESHLCSS
jgi:hypothetical protein